MHFARSLAARLKAHGWLGWVALAAYVTGVAWRIWHIVFAHPPTAFIYSDMSFYYGEAMRWCAGGSFGVKDMLHPPGAGLFYGMLCRLDASFHVANWLTALAASSVPLAIAALARQLYDARVALIALTLASLYFPFIDFFALFISEGPFLFVIFPAFIALVFALRAQGWRAAGAALGAGVALGFATITRPVAIVWLAHLFLAIAWWNLRRAPRHALLVIGALAAGAAAVLAPTASRCTRINEGHFCISATNGPLNLVLGHAPGVRRIVWRDLRDNTYYFASSPVSFQNHSTRDLTLPFAAEDGPANLAYARRLFTSDPGGFLWRSLCEASFLIVGNYPWPTYETAWQRWGIAAEIAFWIFAMLPALYWVARRMRPILRLSSEAQAEILLLIPLLGSVAVSFATVGETRYRVAFDGFMMILGAAAWSRLGAQDRHHSGAVANAGARVNN